MHYFLFSSSQVVVSVLIGALTMVFFGLYFEEGFKVILNAAGSVKNGILSLPIPTKYHNFVRLFLHESTFVFAFFTIFGRMIYSAIFSLARFIWGTVRT